VGPVERLTTRAVHSPGRHYAFRAAITSRLMAQTNAASSRAIAVATTVLRLPLRSSARKRRHSRVCAFHAISRTRRGAAATFACFSRPTRAGCRYAQAASTRMRRARALPALVMPPRLTLSPVELSEGTRPR
jgi:sirohydrochlorin ferrochelatase